jgi:hypothetical protein
MIYIITERVKQTLYDFEFLENAVAQISIAAS